LGIAEKAQHKATVALTKNKKAGDSAPLSSLLLSLVWGGAGDHGDAWDVLIEGAG
jgi:hypothetical protein